MMRPSSFAVFALKALQKSMMLPPAWPRAGPTGGAGVALPAGICSLICPPTFFMKPCLLLRPGPSQLLDLEEVELDRPPPAEDGHHELGVGAVEVDPHPHSLEVREGPV